MTRAAVAAAVLLTAACSPRPGVDGGAPEGGAGECARDGRLEIGSGGGRLRSLPESGGALEIVRGSQGGVHVLVGVWLDDLDLNLELRYRLEDDTGIVGDETRIALRPDLVRPDGARYQRHPDLIILDNTNPSFEPFRGRAVRVRAEASARDGAWVCDERSVILTAAE